MQEASNEILLPEPNLELTYVINSDALRDLSSINNNNPVGINKIILGTPYLKKFL